MRAVMMVVVNNDDNDDYNGNHVDLLPQVPDHE